MSHQHSGLETFFAALGAAPGSQELEAALSLVDAEFTTGPVTKVGRETNQYLVSRAGGVEVLLVDGHARSIFFFIRPVGRPAFEDLGRLVPGLAADTSREEIQAMLGPAVRSMRIYDFYGADGRFVHTEFDVDDRLSLFTVTGFDPLA